MQNHDLFLAPEAVFPICFDEHGERLDKLPATGFSIPGTIQGEGKLAGIPVLFLRLAGCNLRCMWSLPNGEVSICDTPMASFDTRMETRRSIDSVLKLILNNLGKMHHLVISGGEPFLQATNLAILVQRLKQERSVHVTVETNGTLFHEELVRLTDFLSISPKLKNSVPTAAKLEKTGITLPFSPEQADTTRLNLSALQSMISHCRTHPEKDFQLKFVVHQQTEMDEIETSFLKQLVGWRPDDVVLMPLGSTPEQMQQTRMSTIESALERGWRYSPRLQINYFNGIPGV